LKPSHRFLYFYLPKVHKLFYSNLPVVLVNSFQKSGTHMLTEALAAALPLKYNERGIYNHDLTRHWPAELKEKNTSAELVIDFLKNKTWPGELLRGHIDFDAQLAAFLRSASIPHVLIVRHPLHVLLSLANWWERHTEIPVVPFQVFKAIEAPEERLNFLLTGVHKEQQVWPNLVERFQHYAGWLADEACLVLRYEDLQERPKEAAKKLGKHLPVRLNEDKFLQALVRKDTRTYTKVHDRVHTTISEKLRETYLELGGAEIEQTFGYAVPEHTLTT
jgi:hypothetical protein